MGLYKGKTDKKLHYDYSYDLTIYYTLKNDPLARIAFELGWGFEFDEKFFRVFLRDTHISYCVDWTDTEKNIEEYFENSRKMNDNDSLSGILNMTDKVAKGLILAIHNKYVKTMPSPFNPYKSKEI